MKKAYKYRIYPTNKQEVLINKHFGCGRLVYNLALETKQIAYGEYGINLSTYDLMNQIPDLKKDHIFLKEVDSQALQQTIMDLGKAYDGFFKGGRFPKYKNKNQKQSFRNPHGKEIKLENEKIILPKFREGIFIVLDRIPKGEIRNYTISKTPSGKYFISILTETKQAPPSTKLIKENTAIGIDLGLIDFVVCSDGTKISHPKHVNRVMSRLKFLQRQSSKKKKGSSNRKKVNKKISLCHEQVANQRNDFLHKLSTELVKNHDTLCFESLNVKQMQQNKQYAGAIGMSGWGTFLNMVKYKAIWLGKNVLQIPQFEPSTKVCSKCGYKNESLTISDREWVCVCGEVHDRDKNAANVIKNYCIAQYCGGFHRGKSVELPTVVGAKKQKVMNK